MFLIIVFNNMQKATEKLQQNCFKFNIIIQFKAVLKLYTNKAILS